MEAEDQVAGFSKPLDIKLNLHVCGEILLVLSGRIVLLLLLLLLLSLSTGRLWFLSDLQTSVPIYFLSQGALNFNRSLFTGQA